MAKYSIRLILYTHRTNDRGLHPVYLRTTINRKTSYKATGHYLNARAWDEKNEQVRQSHPNADYINAHLSFTKAEWEKKLITSQISGKEITAADLKKSFVSDQQDIFQFVEGFIKRQAGKKSSPTLENYRKHLLKLEKFNGSRVLNFERITNDYLQEYEAWLRENINFRKKDTQKNYVHAIWKTLKTWFNAAKKEGIINHYPFDRYENPVYVAPDKDFLNQTELKKIEDFADSTTDPVLKECAVYFLFGCYSGLRISDWYQFSSDKHIHDGKLRLRPAKTKRKWVEMIISKPLERSLARMKEVSLKLREPTINEKLKVIAKKCEINKHLTTHTGRHTFAVTICLGNRLSSETSAELMGITLATFVGNYSQVTQQKIDAETQQAWRDLA